MAAEEAGAEAYASMAPLDPERARQEAIGAFVHELRTPITSIRMVMEIAKRASPGGPAQLDEELLQMMETSLLDLQGLTDALQELSRLERGRLALRSEPTAMEEVLARAAEITGLRIEGNQGDGIAGYWDRERLTVAMSGIAWAANRCGAGDGIVRCEARSGDNDCAVTLESGSPSGQVKPIDADLGHGFYRGYAIIRAMQGSIEVRRETGYVALRVSLPAKRAP